MKRLVLYILAYFVITMAWAYPWHILIFHEKYVEMGAMTREEPVIPLGILAILIQGTVIGYLYQYYYKGGNCIFQGIKFSLMTGLLVYTAMGFATAAKFQIEPISTFLVYHTIFQAIQFLLTGIALGLIYKDPRIPVAVD